MGRARRRQFLIAAGALLAAPLAAEAQQAGKVRRIGILMSLAADDPEAPPRIAAFAQGLQELGWIDGRNVRIDYRWSAGDVERYRKYAVELVALAPDVILASNTSIVRALQQATRTVPIVFTAATDPVGGGLVASLARPGGNVTGFSQREYGLSAKSLELPKQLAPGVTRVAVLRDPTTTGGVGQLGAIQAVAPSLRVELTPVDVRNAAEIERAINAFARGSNGGLFVTTSASSSLHRKLLITLAAQHRLPAVYPSGFYVNDGGLLSYGPDPIDPFRRAAGYVDRIPKGEKPANLPVQQPTKFELVINLRTARALGLTIPQSVLVRADKVIE